jgi:hypothetical protein
MQALGVQAELDLTEDYSDADEASEEQSTVPKSRKPRRQESKGRLFGEWMDQPELINLSQNERDVALHRLGITDPELGRGFEKWKWQAIVVGSDSLRSRVGKCPLLLECGCPFKVRYREQHDGLWKIQICDIKHDHKNVHPRKRGVPKWVSIQLWG